MSAHHPPGHNEHHNHDLPDLSLFKTSAFVADSAVDFLFAKIEDHIATQRVKALLVPYVTESSLG